jgi:type IV pilus assembly protein PilW
MIEPRRPGAARAGFSLVELMLAMTLSLGLVLGMVAAQQQASRLSRRAETVGRLQDAARLAIAVIEADLRMAGYLGLHSRADWISNRANPGGALPAPFSAAQGERISFCGGNGSQWAIRLEQYVESSNGSYALACAATSGSLPGTDTLTVRRAADAAPASLDPQRVHVQSTRTGGVLFVPAAGCTNPSNAACLPAGYLPANSQSRVLLVRTYYVSPSSTQRPGLPALRRKSLGNVNSSSVGGAMTDEELVTGIEDLQVRLGVDTDGDANLDAYADPGAVPPGARVVAATVWLRVRSEQAEPGHTDDTPYRYADMATAWIPGDGYRRIVVSRTIHLRNTRS